MLIIGHRGASGYRPEHTAAAYELAFLQGADAVEPDIVASSDGVLVIRHENEISGTTDVARHAEFASRRTTKFVDGEMLTGWFTEDFTWAELSTLRARERLPELRPESAGYDGQFGILRLADLLPLIGDRIMVAELKHVAYFDSIGIPLVELFARDVKNWATKDNLITECFELDALAAVRAAGVPGEVIFLMEGTPAYAHHQTREGLAALQVDGVSYDKHQLLASTGKGNVTGATTLVARSQAAGLRVFTWTLRAENFFLPPNFRQGASGAAFGNWRKEFELIRSTGVDGVFADQPDLAASVFNGQIARQGRSVELRGDDFHP